MMRDGLSQAVPRAGFAGRRRMASIRVRQTVDADIRLNDDSDDEAKITKRKYSSRRKSRNEEGNFSTALRASRQLRRRQVISTPEPDEDEDEDDEDEGEETSDSSDSSLDDADGDDSDSSLDSISSGSEDEESEEEPEEDEASPTAPGGGASGSPSFQTLVPGAPGSNEPSQESAIASSTASSTATATEAPSQSSAPTEGVDEPIADSDSTGSIVQDPAATSILGDSTGPSGSGSTEDAASASQISDGDSGGPRGRDIGIVIGTLALAGLLILAGVLLYRRRKRSNEDHLERLDDEKALPPTPPTFRLSGAPQPLGQRTDASIMDEAMGAAYQHEFGGAANLNNDAGRDFKPMNYDNTDATHSSWPAPNAGPVSPVSPGGHLSPTWKPASPRGNPTERDFAAAQSSMAAPQPARLNQEPAPEYYAPPAFPGQEQRYSFAQTEATGVTDGTWSTFANERMKANGGKLPLKERMLGHF